MPAEPTVAFIESPHARQRGIGVVAPFDFALDRELWRWVPDDVSLYLTRMPFVTTPVTVELATTISKRKTVRAATRDVLSPEPAVVVYACTSGSFVAGRAGEQRLVRTMLEAGAPAAVTTSGALVHALAVVRATRVAVVTPYVDTVTARLVRFLAEHGIHTTASLGLGLLGNIWKVPYREIIDAVRAADRPDADAMFISCTNLPTYDIIGPLEHVLGKPVLTANQVSMWAALRAIGADAVGCDQWLVHASRATAA